MKIKTQQHQTYGMLWKQSEKVSLKHNIQKMKIKWKHNNPKPVGHGKSSPKGKVHSNTGTPQETRKKSNK